MLQLVQAVGTIIIAVSLCIAWFWYSNLLLDKVYPASGANINRNLRTAANIRPWLFLGPAILLLTVYLVYPVFNSLWLAMHDARADEFVGMDNFIWLVNDQKFRESMFNNLLWLIFVPTSSTLFGLAAAAVTDKLSWGNFAKSLIFMPMAISFIGASVIWKFIYDYRGGEQDQIGLINALVTALGGEAQAWITVPFYNNFFLMLILIWIQTGFAMVILSAALRGIPEETVEAAVLDGASDWQVFYRIKVPQIWGTIAVVWTTITITVLKVFDIVLAMTNGQWGTQVLANLMFDWMFRGGHLGRASAIAVVIMLLVTPIMILNMRNAHNESK